MKCEHLTPFPSLAMLFVLLLVCGPGVALADRVAHYRVTIDNLTGQPFSPPVAVTHQGSLDVSQVVATASAEPGGTAEDGKQNTRPAGYFIGWDEFRCLRDRSAHPLYATAHPG
jgi:hypothetical protein